MNNIAQNGELRNRVATHQAASAYLRMIESGPESIVRVTIVPCNHALGFTEWMPREDAFIESSSALRKRIVAMLAGIAAGKTLLKADATGTENLSANASSLEQASQLACRYVDQVEFISDPDVRLTRVSTLISECLAEAEQHVQDNEAPILKLRDALLENGSLTGADLARLLS